MEITTKQLATLIQVVARGEPYATIYGDGWQISPEEIKALIINVLNA